MSHSQDRGLSASTSAVGLGALYLLCLLGKEAGKVCDGAGIVDDCGFFLPGDELPCDMRIPSDKQDKLHGCLEHLFNQVGPLSQSWPDLEFCPSPLVRTHTPGARAGGVGHGSLWVKGQDLEDPGSHTNLQLAATQVDSIHALLKGPIMSRAFEETKHFPMDHSLQGKQTGIPRQGHG